MPTQEGVPSSHAGWAAEAKVEVWQGNRSFLLALSLSFDLLYGLVAAAHDDELYVKRNN